MSIMAYTWLWLSWLKLSPICETVCLLRGRQLLVMQGWHHLVARVLRYMKLVEMASWAGTALQYWKCDIAWRKAALRSQVKDVLHTADNPPTLYNASDSGPRMVDRQPVSPEPALFGEQGSHCGQDCSYNGDKKHAVDNTNAIWCSDCAMQLNGDVQLAFHLQGLLHRKGVQRSRRLALSSLYRIAPTNQLAHGSER